MQNQKVVKKDSLLGTGTSLSENLVNRIRKVRTIQVNS